MTSESKASVPKPAPAPAPSGAPAKPKKKKKKRTEARLEPVADEILTVLDPLARVVPELVRTRPRGAHEGERARGDEPDERAPTPKRVIDPDETASLPRVRRTSKGLFRTLKERIYGISQALVKAQKPIRILDAIKWDEGAYAFFKKTGFKELPPIDRRYYQAIELRFDPDRKLEELQRIESRTIKDLGEKDELGAILLRNCREYQKVVRMLKARGTPDFHRYSRELYGSPKDVFIDGETTLRQLGFQVYEILSGLTGDRLGVQHERSLSAEQCVALLNRGFEAYFGPGEVRAKLSDGIVSDAAAGSDYVKVKRGATFSQRDVEILEVHEGWVHVGTSRNGSVQHVATWLAKGPPCTTATQEGLAVLMELFAFVTLPSRARRLTNRVLAIDKAEDGADALDIIEFFRTEGLDEEQCITNTQRVFRGGDIRGGSPFTKDISYCKGFVQNYNFLRSCVALGRPELIPFLFVGKVTLEDVPVLYARSLDGVVDPPAFVPRQFSDLNALAVWMAYSSFFNRMDLAKVQNALRGVILRR